MRDNQTKRLNPSPTLAFLVAAGLLLLVPQVASADTVMLLMQSGPETPERLQLLSNQLEEAGHTTMVTGASLEDSALMLGCQPSEASCIDTVIETAGADAAVIVPHDTGDLLVHRQGVSKRERVAAGASDYDWQLALSTAFGLPAPQAPASEPANGADLSGLSSSSNSSGGAFDFSRVKTRSWIVVGSGVAVSGVGLILLSVASGKQDEVDKHPVDTAADLESLRSLESSGENYNRAGNIFFIGGGLATLTGIGLMVWDMKSGSGESGPTMVPTASQTSVGVSVRWDNF